MPTQAQRQNPDLIPVLRKNPPPRDHQIYDLVHVKLRTQQEVAQKLGISQATVSRRLKSFSLWMAFSAPADYGELTEEAKLRLAQRHWRLVVDDSQKTLRREFERSCQPLKTTKVRKKEKDGKVEVITETTTREQLGKAAYVREWNRLEKEKVNFAAGYLQPCKEPLKVAADMDIDQRLAGVAQQRQLEEENPRLKQQVELQRQQMESLMQALQQATAKLEAAERRITELEEERRRDGEKERQRDGGGKNGATAANGHAAEPKDEGWIDITGRRYRHAAREAVEECRQYLLRKHRADRPREILLDENLHGIPDPKGMTPLQWLERQIPCSIWCHYGKEVVKGTAWQMGG